MFINGRQEDAHEFLKLLLDHMERSYLVYRKATKLDHLSRQTTPVNQIFGGYLRQQVSCPSCGYVSTTFSHFQDLVLDIRNSNTIELALEQYFRKETLDTANCYKCERCKKKVPATKRSLVEKAPNVLLIQLKRFTFSGGKINKHVAIQRHIDLSRWVNGPHKLYSPAKGGGMKQAHLNGVDVDAYKYKLVSMVIHLGGSQHGGHYIAVAEGGNGSMYEFDDCSVRSASIQTALLRNPYILFYELVKRKSAQVNGGGTTTAASPNAVTGANNYFGGKLLTEKHNNSSSCKLAGVTSANSRASSSSPLPQQQRQNNQRCHSPIVRQNSDHVLVRTHSSLLRQHSDPKLPLSQPMRPLANGAAKEDLGEVVRKENHTKAGTLPAMGNR